MIDIKRLEKLSCLQLSEEVKESVSKSIDGIVNIMKEIEKLDMPILKANSYRKTDLSVNAKEKLYSKNSIVSGVHLEEAVFLAPKVIKK